MWRAVIADDEGIILNGLKKLIDWDSLGVEIIGDAGDGQQLRQVIEESDPDLVITDIMMPRMTGLEILSWYQVSYTRAKFIFISGYQEFSYAREALQNGAVDYLLKPVGRKELEDAVRKAIGMLKDQNPVEIFREYTNEIQALFQEINDGNGYEQQEFYRLFAEQHIEFENHVFAGISIGIRPDIADELSAQSFQRYNLLRFSVYNRVEEAFHKKKCGFIINKDDSAMHLIGVFPKEREADFLGTYVEPICRQVEAESNTQLCVGIGMPTDQISMLKNTYKTAKFSFDLYFFEEKPMICFEEIHKNYTVSFDDFEDSVEQAFRAIVAKDSTVMDKIDYIMDNIRAIHYGNSYAALTRTMNFTGDLGMKLYRYHMFDADFYQMQDELQRKVKGKKTFRALKKCIHEHYEGLIRCIYETGKSKDKVLIEQVKDYIRENYTEDLSIRELADVACVSQNYFSAMFKKETGQNYKAYLTQIRMEAALKLLQETDDKTYEIGEKVGYNNVRRFVDAFKQIYSVSPMEYKKALKKE